MRSFAIAGVWLCLAASEAMACTVLIPPPRPGETGLHASIRAERVEQRRLRAASTHVYLARVAAGGDERLPIFISLAPIEGGAPPRRIADRDATSCEVTTPIPGEARLIFVRRVSPSDAPWRPWTWGSGRVLGSRLPSQIVYAGIVEALDRAVRSKGRR